MALGFYDFDPSICKMGINRDYYLEELRVRRTWNTQLPVAGVQDAPGK